MRQIKAVFNGSFDSIENIKVSPFSRAYTFSDSVYEVLPFYNKKLIAFKSHIERLQRSVDAINITIDSKKLQMKLINCYLHQTLKMVMFIIKLQEDKI